MEPTTPRPPTVPPPPRPYNSPDMMLDGALFPVWGPPAPRERPDLTPADAAELVCSAVEAHFDALRELHALLRGIGHFIGRLPRGGTGDERDAVLVVSRLVGLADPMAERLVEEIALVAAEFLPRLRPVAPSTEGV